MENRNGKGIFLGVVSVATLIVAIIGATFAYFTATVGTNNDAVNLTSYEFNATMSVSKLAPASGTLIPVNASDVFALASNTRNNNNGACMDKEGYAACAIYEFTITNNSKDVLLLTGEIVNKAVTAFTNLKVQFATKSNTTYTANGDAITISAANANAKTSLAYGSSNNTTVFTVPAHDGTNAGSLTMYFIIFLNNTSDAAQADEQAQNFVGELLFTSTGGAQLQATLTPAA